MNTDDACCTQKSGNSDKNRKRLHPVSTTPPFAECRLQGSGRGRQRGRRRPGCRHGRLRMHHNCQNGKTGKTTNNMCEVRGWLPYVHVWKFVLIFQGGGQALRGACRARAGAEDAERCGQDEGRGRHCR